MRIAICILLVIFNCSIAVESGAEEIDVMVAPPHFFNIVSTTSTSALSMQCEGDKPYKVINCSFSEINIRPPVDGICLISQYTYYETMHRITKNRWTTNLYGGGMRTIEKDPTSDVLWRYTEVTNDTPSKINTYTWNSPSRFSVESLGCKYIQFQGVNRAH